MITTQECVFDLNQTINPFFRNSILQWFKPVCSSKRASISLFDDEDMNFWIFDTTHFYALKKTKRLTYLSFDKVFVLFTLGRNIQ